MKAALFRGLRSSRFAGRWGHIYALQPCASHRLPEAVAEANQFVSILQVVRLYCFIYSFSLTCAVLTGLNCSRTMLITRPAAINGKRARSPSAIFTSLSLQHLEPLQPHCTPGIPAKQPPSHYLCPQTLNSSNCAHNPTDA